MGRGIDSDFYSSNYDVQDEVIRILGFKVATKILWVKDLRFKVATDMLLVLTQIYVATIITLLVEAVPLVLEGSREQNVL